MDWVDVIHVPSVKGTKHKAKRQATVKWCDGSVTVVHGTINGQGLVARLRAKNQNQGRK